MLLQGAYLNQINICVNAFYSHKSIQNTNAIL